jgi:hypothetical protein
MLVALHIWFKFIMICLLQIIRILKMQTEVKQMKKVLFLNQNNKDINNP